MAVSLRGNSLGRLIGLSLLAWLVVGLYMLSYTDTGADTQGFLPQDFIRSINKREIHCELQTVSSHVHYEPIKEEYTTEDEVTFSCANVNWTLIGSGTSSCLATGSWSSEPPSCRYIVCPPLEVHDHGKLKRTNYPSPPLSNATYGCEEGYELSGNSVRTCSMEGEWKGEIPDCLVSCGKLPAQASSVARHQCTYVNCTATFSCYIGFVFRGTNSRTSDEELVCDTTGLWNGRKSYDCVAVTCEEPADFPDADKTFDKAALDGRYGYKTKLTYSCKKDVSMTTSDDNNKKGEFVLTCGDDGSWSGEQPTCTDLDKTTTPVDDLQATSTSPTGSEVSTPAPSTLCDLPEPFPQGEYRIYGKTLVYKCEPGFILEGTSERICLGNKTWNGTAPTCVANTSYTTETMIITPKPVLWKQVFVENKEWHGTYVFRGSPFIFTLYILTDTQPDDGLTALIVDDLPADLPKAKFNLKVFHSGQNTITLNRTRLLEPGDRFPTNVTLWSVVGHVEKHSRSGKWIYNGRITSSLMGFSDFHMTPVQKLTSAPGGPNSLHSTESSVTAMALGVTIAIIAIAIAAALAAFCVTRKNGIRGQGHRSLTSFENPVYEYENSLKC